jgi:hypothetical protein
MPKRKMMTCDEHRALGARVKRAEELLREINSTVGRGVGHSKKAGKLAYRLYVKFCEDLKNELDEALNRDCPEMDLKERRRIYYGPTVDDKVEMIR